VNILQGNLHWGILSAYKTNCLYVHMWRKSNFKIRRIVFRTVRGKSKFDATKYTADKETHELQNDTTEHPHIKWTEDKDELVNSVTVHGIHVPEKYHHYVEDPYGIKNERDKKLLARVERWQKRSRLRKFRDSQHQEQGPSRRQLTLSQRLLDELNVIITEDTVNVMDSALATNKSNIIYSPILVNGGVSFTDVQLTSDLLIARCSWFCKPHYEILVRNELAAKKPEIRKILATRVRMKYIPKLEFNFDEKTITYQNVERLVQQHEEGKKANKKIDRHSLSPEERSQFYQNLLKAQLREHGVSLYIPSLLKDEQEPLVEDQQNVDNEDFTAESVRQSFINPRKKKNPSS